MFWLCYEEYHNGEVRRSWIVEREDSPDKPDENGECAYPFNGTHGYVVGSYYTEREAYEADYVLWDEEA